MSDAAGAGEPQLTLHDAAGELGVHYMTAYRYVRLGQLPAHKVGGSWRVARADLEAFRAGAAAGSAVVTADGARRDAPWAERFEQRLIAGDSRGAWGVLESALTSGASMTDAYLDVFAPALRSIGERWAHGEIDIAVEHRASAAAHGLIGRLSALSNRRGRTKGAVVLGAPSGERHSLPLAILAECLRVDGWEVCDLGADVPLASFVYAVEREPTLVAVGVSATIDEHLALAGEIVAAIHGTRPDVCVVLGGSAIRDLDHARSCGADRYAADAREFAALLNELTSTGTMPKG